jgi:hypothetical protein
MKRVAFAMLKRLKGDPEMLKRSPRRNSRRARCGVLSRWPTKPVTSCAGEPEVRRVWQLGGSHDNTDG